MEEKEFIIPKNAKAEFEVIQNVRLKDLLLFAPSVIIDVPVVLWMPIHIAAKIAICGFSIFIPLMLVYIRPVRENIPAWKHFYWKFKFLTGQRKFYYRKEVYTHATIIQIQEENGTGNEIIAKSNTIKGNRFRINLNTRQLLDSGNKSKRTKPGFNEQIGTKEPISKI